MFWPEEPQKYEITASLQKVDLVTGVGGPQTSEVCPMRREQVSRINGSSKSVPTGSSPYCGKWSSCFCRCRESSRTEFTEENSLGSLREQKDVIKTLSIQFPKQSLGIGVKDSIGGVVIVAIRPGSDAQRLGLQIRDTIVAVGGRHFEAGAHCSRTAFLAVLESSSSNPIITVERRLFISPRSPERLPEPLSKTKDEVAECHLKTRERNTGAGGDFGSQSRPGTAM